jgi:flagellum-specific ATP synthase
MIRIKAALVATAIAEYFRDMGLDVLFMLDSVTRFAMAQREVGLTVGEPPATRGYPPSVFAMMPRLMERAGASDRGTITALYTVLVEGDDMNEPIGDTARSILDGHIILSREIAARNHHPSIDILNSVSRLASAINTKEHLRAAAWLRKNLAVYRQGEDLINIGAYKHGSSADIDQAILNIDAINNYLRQDVGEKVTYEEAVNNLIKISGGAQ